MRGAVAALKRCGYGFGAEDDDDEGALRLSRRFATFETTLLRAGAGSEALVGTGSGTPKMPKRRSPAEMAWMGKMLSRVSINDSFVESSEKLSVVKDCLENKSVIQLRGEVDTASIPQVVNLLFRTQLPHPFF